jgi:PPM family protein phosphatase
VAVKIVEQAYLSDTGRQRTANEDSFFAGSPVFAVADGMGGAQAGEVASRMAAESFESAERGDSSPEAYLRGIAEDANRRIHDLAASDETRSGMGTTFTAVQVDGDDVSIAHVGDSRAYVFRDGDLRLLTSDHSLVEELRRQGKLTPEQAEDHPQRSIITRALGPEPDVEVDTMTYRVREGDVYLLCSDGLTTMVKDAEIAAILAGATSLRDAADKLGPTAAEAGLTAEHVREEASRRRGDGARRAAPPRRKRSVLRGIVKTFVVLAIIAGVCALAVVGARQIYFLGGDEGGRVALYRGLPYDLPLGIETYSEVESFPIQVDSLRQADQKTATDHELRSEDDARSLVDSFEGSKPKPKPEPDRNGGDRKAGGGGGKQPGGGGGGQAGGAGGAGN